MDDGTIRTSRGDFGCDAESLLRILRILRAPGGCPWDRAQTRRTLTRSLAGECAEVIDAIDADTPEEICEELGDLLMNALFQVVIAEEKHEFTMTDVWRSINEKMVRRHAHIFGDANADTPEEVAALWAKIKEREHAGEAKPESRLDKVPRSLSALTRSAELQKQAAKVGFDWPDASGAASCCFHFQSFLGRVFAMLFQERKIEAEKKKKRIVVMQPKNQRKNGRKMLKMI